MVSVEYIMIVIIITKTRKAVGGTRKGGKGMTENLGRTGKLGRVVRKGVGRQGVRKSRDWSLNFDTVVAPCAGIIGQIQFNSTNYFQSGLSKTLPQGPL
jgi:hypothetical protein